MEVEFSEDELRERALVGSYWRAVGRNVEEDTFVEWLKEERAEDNEVVRDRVGQVRSLTALVLLL